MKKNYSKREFITRSIIMAGVMLLAIFLQTATGQTSVFFDDFNRASVSPGGTPSMTYVTTNTGAGNAVIESTLTTGTVPYLKVSNGNPAGRSYVTGSLSTFGAPFNTVLSSNTGLVTWSFNIRHNRGGGSTTTMSGFGAGAYGIAAVLAATGSDFLAAGCNGYAVVMGAPSSGNVYHLIRFTNGLTANANCTIIATGTLPTSTAPNNLRDYMSIKVTYDPATGNWKLYERIDGPSSAAAWADPSTLTEANLVNSGTDNTYTSSVMTSFGYFWNYSTSSGVNSYFDNFGVTVTPVVVPSLTVLPTTLTGFNYVEGSGPSASKQYTISGVNLNGSQITITGSSNYEVSSDDITFQGSVVIPNPGATLSSTTIYVRLKAGLTSGNYNNETIDNAGGGASAATVTCSGFVLPPPTVYHWAGSNNGDWQNAANWNPVRTTPFVNDILLFDNGNHDTVVNVPTQTIAQLKISDGSVIILKPGAAAMLTIAGEAGTDLEVGGNSAGLHVASGSIFNILLNTGVTGNIEGSMIFSGASHTLKTTDAGSLIFANGSACKVTTGFLGNLFGTTSLNSVLFKAGSTYIQDAGSNPFGAGQPFSVVVFETGSLYKFTAPTGGPSYSGRTYANFENDSPLSTQNNQGSNPWTCDNYVVTSGIVNWDFTGGCNIKGNISVAAGATLTFGNGTRATTLNLSGGAAQTIAGEGTLTFGANSTIVLNNSNGLGLLRDVTANHLTFQAGRLTTGSYILTVNGNITGAETGKYINGNLKLNIAAGSPTINFPIGDDVNYAPVMLNFTDVSVAGKITAFTVPQAHSEIATSGLDVTKCLNRYYSLTDAGTSFASCNATFNFVAGDIPAGADPSSFIAMKWDPSSWSQTTVGTLTPTSTSVTGITSFSEFQIGEAPEQPPVAFNITGGGSYCTGGEGVSIGLDGSELWVSYQVFFGITAVGTPVTGDGNPVNLGLFTEEGNYTVTGTHLLSGLSSQMTGNAAVQILLPVPVAVTISSSSNPSLSGMPVNFSAALVNGGSNPSFQWYRNGLPSGPDSPDYSFMPVDGDEVYCVATSDAGCITGNPAVSGTIFQTVVIAPVDLTIRNLTVHASDAYCFDAVNTITVAGDGAVFMVEPLGSVTFIAGKKVRLLAGTMVAEGGYLNAYISTEFCPMQNAPLGSVIYGTPESMIITQMPDIIAYPNPTSGNFTVAMKGDLDIPGLRGEIYNMQGARVMTLDLAGASTHVVTFTDAQPGLYFLRVVAGNSVKTLKIVRY